MNTDEDVPVESAMQEDERRRAEAIGKASEALECIERARGHLFSFHQLMGRGDLQFGDACELLEKVGLSDDGVRLHREIVGRHALDGRWSFQIVDEFDDLYYLPARDEVRRLEDLHLNGRRHVHESNIESGMPYSGPCRPHVSAQSMFRRLLNGEPALCSATALR
jgi:hypothetical protein